MKDTSAMKDGRTERFSNTNEIVQNQKETSDGIDPASSTISGSNGMNTGASQSPRIGRKRPRVTRLVSRDFGSPYISENDEDTSSLKTKNPKRSPSLSDSPMHCVSEFDGVSEVAATDDTGAVIPPPYPNPLCSKRLLLNHVRSVRLEIELFPMRQLVARLMAHPTHNRRGIFNRPVDPVALGLPDYHKIITSPMDLGTVKAKLFAVAYGTRDEVGRDIRRVFQNAIIYNPQDNPVHIAAKSLLNIFEESYEVIQAARAADVTASSSSSSADAKRSSFVAQSKQECSQPIASANRPPGFPARAPSAPTILLPSREGTAVPGPKTPPSAPDSSSSVSPGGTEKPTDGPLGAKVTPVGERKTFPAPSVDCDLFASFANPARSSLRGSIILEDPFHSGPSYVDKALKRAKNVAAKHARHSCRSCLGRSCGICGQGCLSLEPPLLICAGPNCAGAKIRKGATYFTAKDGSRQFCQRCYTNLQAVLPHTSDQFDSMGTAVRYKRDLLKRKNDEEIAENWLTCHLCQRGVHKICAMNNEFVHSEDDYVCPDCSIGEPTRQTPQVPPPSPHDGIYSFVSGSEAPVKLGDLVGSGSAVPSCVRAESLPETSVSKFMEAKVRLCMANADVAANAEKTVFVRPISSCGKQFKVPEVVRKHFRQQSQRDATDRRGVVPPATVKYTSKSIALFQKIDGMDVCLFCMYVHEYDCDDDFAGGEEGTQSKRVYIAYLDSVEYFRPRKCRTGVYHEMLISYLASARARGYESAHIWACPPSRGNSFVFWNHPASQRTPNKDHLISWYHTALSRGVNAGVITDVTSLFESSFPFPTKPTTDPNEVENTVPLEDGVLGGRLICPPLMDGDFWIEEAVRIHALSISKNAKPRPGKDDFEQGSCPATQIASLLSNKVLPHESSRPFRKPVNAAALKLKDYHKIIENPMDLGTVYSRCVLGEYETLGDLVADVDLVFSNAMKYNPKGHVVHSQAIEMKHYFEKELNDLVSRWSMAESNGGWDSVAHVSMSLDNFHPAAATAQVTNRSVTPDNLCNTGGSQSGTPPLLSALTQAKMSDDHKHLNMDQTISKGRVVVVNAGRKPTHAKAQRGRKSSSSRMMDDMLTKKLELLQHGEDAIIQRMVGDDVWLLDKRYPNPQKASTSGRKKGSGKRKKPAIAEAPELPGKRRRQSWLGEEVGTSMRRMRNAFFVCRLTARDEMSDKEKSMMGEYEKYVEDFDVDGAAEENTLQCRLADARAGLLEFSQYRNLEFDTLRRAKYSSSVLLYHLHNKDAPGLIPACSSCKSTIREVRWHRIRHLEDRYHTGRVPPTLRTARAAQMTPELAEACHRGEELCVACFKESGKKEEDFIPLPISFKA